MLVIEIRMLDKASEGPWVGMRIEVKSFDDDSIRMQT